MAMAYPEAVCLARQMRDVLVGKQIADVSVEDATGTAGGWRFGSIEQAPPVFHSRLHAATITGAESVANTVFLPTDSGHVLALGYLSGKVLYHPPGETPPRRSCLRLRFTDDSHLSVVISLWGLIRVLSGRERDEYLSKWYGRAIEPNSQEYTCTGFQKAAGEAQDKKLSVKKFLHAFGPGYYVSGLDSGYAIEILHRAKIHPKRTLASLTRDEHRACYHSVNCVTKEAVCQGGRSSEADLYGRPGGYVPRVCKDTVGQPCLECGTEIVKFSFEGGACYVCPSCQSL